MNQNDWFHIKRRLPISESTARRNADNVTGLRADLQEPVEGDSLVGVASGEDQGRSSPLQRLRIRFTIYSTRPCDWDGYHVKELQDMLIKAAILPADDWRVLQGEVVSEKVHTKKEERTEIVIQQL